jgi:hypothetical protein
MKTFTIVVLAVLATTLFVRSGQAQGTLVPLYLTITGDGSVTPLQNEQLLEVGQSYEMDAIPDAGYVFAGWQQVNFFVLDQTTINPDGQTNPPTISITASPIPGIYSGQTMLDFMLQPATVVYNDPGVEEISEASGWQADFTPVPEPSSNALTISGLMAVTLLLKWQPGRRRFNR